MVSFENRFWSLFESGELSDVTLIVGEQKERIRSHKVVLAAASPVFKKYFTNGEITNELNIPTVEPEIFYLFLKFVYTGELSFEVKNIIPLMNAARYFQVQKLVTVCEKMLTNASTEESALMIFQQAILYGEKELEEAAKKIVCRYAHKIMETDEFLEIDEECLLKFLGNDDLTVKNEVQVFDALIRWAKAECARQRVVTTSKYCRSHLEKLIPLIRFPQMDEGDFALKVAHGEIKILTQEELLSVWFFHKIPAERRSEVPPGLFNSRPRCYIDSVKETIQPIGIPVADLKHKKQFKVLFYTREDQGTEREVIFYVPKHPRITVKDVLTELARVLAEDYKPLKRLRLLEIISHRISAIIDDDVSADVVHNTAVNRYYRAEEICPEDTVSGLDEIVVQVAHFYKETQSTFGVPFFFKVRYGETWTAVKERLQARLGMNEKDWAKVRISLVRQGTPNFVEIEEEAATVKAENFTTYSGGFQGRPWIGIEQLKKDPKRY